MIRGCNLGNRILQLAAIVGVVSASAPAASAPGDLAVEAYGFDLALPDGRHLTSRDLVGAVIEMDDQAGHLVTARIDKVTPSSERPDILLHEISVLDPAKGTWRPMCAPDVYGRRAAFPVPGRWEGRFIKDPASWFLTCTAGSQAKCILLGYDPWRSGPHGEDLVRYYDACQHMVSADYEGSDTPHTRNGTIIDIWDVAGIQPRDTEADPAFAFEAGWTSAGAVCVARTRWTDILKTEVLLARAPNLAASPCDEAEARRRGAILFNRSRFVPLADEPGSVRRGE